MKKITKSLVLFGLMMSSICSAGTAQITVKFPNKSFVLTQSKRDHKHNEWDHTTLTPANWAENTYTWDPGAKTDYRYMVNGIANNHQINLNTSVATFKGHPSWLWDFKPDGTYTLGYKNSNGSYTIIDLEPLLIH